MSFVAMVRALPFRTAAAATAVVLAAALSGCTAAPEPPEQPSSMARLAAALEEFGNGMLDDGAPAVLMQAKVRGEEWSRASGVRSLEGTEPVEIGDPVQQGSLPEVLSTGRTHRELLALAATRRWEGRLAQGFEYSNSNYIALGMIVERLRGRPIGEVLRSEVVEPLGLEATRMTGPGQAPPGLVHGYVTSFGERLDVSYPALHSGDPAGGLVSSVGDLNTFFAALLQDRLIPRAMVTEMQAPLYARYGLGIQRWNDTCTNNFYYGHAGDTAGYGTLTMSSADGTRQASVALAYPPQPFSFTGNGIVEELIDVVEEALNSSC